MNWCCKAVSCFFKKQNLFFSFRQRKGHKQNQGLQLKAQYDNSLTLDTPLLTRKMVLYIVYFFTFWQLLYDFNKDCKQTFPVLTLLLLQALASVPRCPWGAGLSVSIRLSRETLDKGFLPSAGAWGRAQALWSQLWLCLVPG